MKKEWEILYIPGKPPIPVNQQPTVDTFASIIEPKIANTLIRRLNQMAPLENLRHVKRVRKKCVQGGKIQLSVVLCLASGNENQLESIPNNVRELINAYQLSPFITKVSKYAASSKEEWEEQCKLWPTSYHPPTFNIDGITGFSEEDSQSIFNFMQVAVGLAKSSPISDQVVNAAVIVDPSVRQVIASACDQVCSLRAPTNNTSLGTSYIEHPEIDAVAINYARGSNCAQDTNQKNCAHDKCTRLYTSVSCLYPWRWTEKQQNTGSNCSWHPLRHAALVAIEYAAARDRHLFPVLRHSEDQSIQIDQQKISSESLSAKRQKTDFPKDKDSMTLEACSNGFHSEGTRPYLCTGFDVYLVWEPCTLCAMALVHQRIRRIFYTFPNPNAGALGSVHRLQGEKSLNHHYAVFRVLLPEEIL